jgi:glycosyltransferase involved in cell wall biosynthesis
MKKIAFIKVGYFSGTNKSVELQLIKQFPEFEVEIIDVLDLIKRRGDIILINLFYVIREYGRAIILRKKNFFTSFFVTSFIFKKIKLLISQQVTKDEYIFSFQTQSLFDASVDGIPHFVYTDHTVLANLYYPNMNYNKLLFSAPWMKLEKSIYENATKIFSMSNNISDSIVKQYSCDSKKVICIYVGSNAKVENKILNNDDYRNKTILFIGKNWKNKGGPELIEAFKLVQKKHKDAKLIIIGCSPDLHMPNCEVVGFVPLEHISEYYRKSSIFCLPTRIEAFGIVYIEAMAHKIPVIGSHSGARPDFIINEFNGYLIDPNNIDQIAHALIKLIENPEKCKQYGINGYSIFIDKYNWEKVGEKLRQNILESINLS